MSSGFQKLSPGRAGNRVRGNRPGLERESAPLAALSLPLGLTLCLVLLSFTTRVQTNIILVWSFWAAAGFLLVWQAALFLRLKSRALTAEPDSTWRRSIEVVLRPQHYVQACVQFSVFAYWGYYWSPVYEHAWLIVAQLLFAYSLDMLVVWSRRQTYVLGFGPFPIIFSINLFIWFHDQWFYLQFLMIMVGILGKEFVRWNRDGKSSHIFNPSAFSLGLISLILILTGSTDLTWGPQIASTLTLAPQIYLFLFLTGLIVMYFFSITLVAGTAAATLFGLSALYSALTGVPYFLDSEIPAAVFLGLHLLITDPSTSPRTPLGKAIFGGLYGLGVFALYALLGRLGVPTFYDKLLCVPLLNLSVRIIDHQVMRIKASAAWKRWYKERDWSRKRVNNTHMAIWIVFFAAMTALGATDSRHTGDSLPFWQQACADDRRNACDRLLQIEATYCRDNSAWACNELGAHYTEGLIVAADSSLARGYFSRACELRSQAGCFNLLDQSTISRPDPGVLDLRLMLREAGRNLMAMPEPELYARACEHEWSFACEIQ